MTKNKVKVSIIIPVYNVQKYLEKCIKSVTSQTLKEIEIFLIDDGSTDVSWEIIQKFAKKDKRIVAIQQENAGAAVARNQGLALAKGDYIGFVDSDDYVDSDYFEELYKAAIKYKSDITRAYVKAEIETSDDYQLNHSVDGYNSYYNVRLKKEALANKLSLTSSNWLAIYKRSLLDKHNIRFIPEIRTGQDNIFNLHISYVANKVSFVDKETYYHMVRRDGSLMTGYNFTAEGLLSRALVIEETVRFLNTTKNYDMDIYANRVKDVLDFFHSRLIKMPRLSKETRKQLTDILVPIWKDVRNKERVTWLLRDDPRFIKALDSAEGLNKYFNYIVPARRILSSAERKRQTAKTKIRRNKAAYKALRPPIVALRKANKLLNKILY